MNTVKCKKDVSVGTTLIFRKGEIYEYEKFNGFICITSKIPLYGKPITMRIYNDEVGKVFTRISILKVRIL